MAVINEGEDLTETGEEVVAKVKQFLLIWMQMQ